MASHGGKRQGAGRPANPIPTETKPISLPIELWRMVDAYAGYNGKKRSEFLRELIMEGFRHIPSTTIPEITTINVTKNSPHTQHAEKQKRQTRPRGEYLEIGKQALEKATQQSERISVDDWKKTFFTLYGNVTNEAKAKAFKKVLQEMSEKKLAIIEEHFVSRPHNDQFSTDLGE